jgi:heptosyltransferase-2
MLNISKILIIRGGALGDFILTIPLLHSLRKSFLESHIELMANTSFAPLTRGYINNWESIEKNGIWNYFCENKELPFELSDYFSKFDLIVLLRPDKEGVFKKNLERSGVRNIIYKDPASVPDEIHFSRYLIDSLLPLGITANGYKPNINFIDEELRFAEGFFENNELAEDVVAIHPGSGSEKKNWMAERFAGVANILSKKGMKVILISGPADEKEKENFLNKVNFKPIIAENIPLMKLAAILKRCAFYIGNDSGITHLSALTGVNTFAIYAPTNPATWRPLGENITVIKKESLIDIKVEDVLSYLFK